MCFSYLRVRKVWRQIFAMQTSIGEESNGKKIYVGNMYSVKRGILTLHCCLQPYRDLYKANDTANNVFDILIKLFRLASSV